VYATRSTVQPCATTGGANDARNYERDIDGRFQLARGAGLGAHAHEIARCSRADRSSVGLLLCPTFPLPGSLETGSINPSAAPRLYYTPA
jgi:hypothetical protein